MEDATFWNARAAIYAHCARTGRVPSPDELSAVLAISPAESHTLLRALHDRHALVYDEETARILMAHPFSGIETPFEAEVEGLHFWANCAWDALGIPAALHKHDAALTIGDPLGGPAFHLTLRDGVIEGEGIVHFLIPFRHWYDDLVET